MMNTCRWNAERAEVLIVQQAAQQRGLDRLDAQMLLLYAMQQPTHDRAWLLIHDTDVLSAAQLDHWHDLVERRLAGEPTAYLVGRKAFFGLDLAVDARVLVPRPDTECLVAWALACLQNIPTPSVVDLGTGSGAIGLSIKSEYPIASTFYGDKTNKMPNVTGVYIPDGVNGDKVRSAMLHDFNIEIGTSFGQLHGKIWRIGAMGYNARLDCVMQTLSTLEIVLAAEGHKFTRGAGVDAAYQSYKNT